MATDAAGFFPL